MILFISTSKLVSACLWLSFASFFLIKIFVLRLKSAVETTVLVLCKHEGLCFLVVTYVLAGGFYCMEGNSKKGFLECRHLGIL